MKKTGKIVLAVCAMMTMTMAAFAQNSNSFNATASTIRNDVNYSMDPRYYMDAEIGNFLAFLNVNTDKSPDGGYLDLGFAKNFGSFYLGANYYGDFWGNAKGSKNSTLPNVVVETTTDKCKNEFGILAGFMNFGIKFNFAIDADSSKTVTTTTTPGLPPLKEPSTTTETTETNTTKFRIGGTFGGSFDFSPFTLKPIAYFGYHKNGAGDEDAFLMNLGADFVFGGKSLEQIAGLKYTLYAGSAEVGSSKVSHPVNTIDLYYKAHFNLGSNAEIGADAHIINSFDSNKTTDSNGNTTSNVFIYKLTSNAAIGVKYYVKPSQFAVNTGINVELPNVTATSYPDSKIKRYSTTSDCNFPTTIYSGCELNLNKNWLLDTSLSFQMGNVNKSLFNNMTFGVSYRK